MSVSSQELIPAPVREVRAHVAAEHTRVRTLVDELVREALQTGRKVGHRNLRDRLAALRAAIEHAIELEERELVPLLRTVGASGDARVDRLRERRARALCAVKHFEDDVAADRHGRCDLVARAEELVTALSNDLQEDRDGIELER